MLKNNLKVVDGVLVNTVTGAVVTEEEIIEMRGEPHLLDGMPFVVDAHGLNLPDLYDVNGLRLFEYDDSVYCIDQSNTLVNLVLGVFDLINYKRHLTFDARNRNRINKALIKMINSLDNSGDLIIYDRNPEILAVMRLIDAVDHKYVVSIPRLGKAYHVNDDGNIELYKGLYEDITPISYQLEYEPFKINEADAYGPEIPQVDADAKLIFAKHLKYLISLKHGMEELGVVRGTNMMQNDKINDEFKDVMQLVYEAEQTYTDAMNEILNNLVCDLSGLGMIKPYNTPKSYDYTQDYDF